MVAWTGGSVPSKEEKRTPAFRELRSQLFRDEVGICGGLDLWACAGTTALERARIFWNNANLNAHATLRDQRRRNI